MNNKLMIFDDDKDLLVICAGIFTKLGWEVYPEPDCCQILTKVRSIQPGVILMDNRIPDEGGIAATRRLKAEADLKHIPVIYFSASRNVKELADEAGADAYITKPFDLTEFEQLVMQYRQS